MFRDGTNREEHYKYSNFLAVMKHLCKEVLEYQDVPRGIGTHMLRKTGYLLAVWWAFEKGHGKDGELPFTVHTGITKSARHTCQSHIHRYVKDAHSKFFYSKQAGVVEGNIVPDWADIHVQDQCAFETVAAGCKKLQRPIRDLAEHYITTTMKCPTDTLKELQRAYLKCVINVKEEKKIPITEDFKSGLSKFNLDEAQMRGVLHLQFWTP